MIVHFQLPLSGSLLHLRECEECRQLNLSTPSLGITDPTDIYRDSTSVAMTFNSLSRDHSHYFENIKAASEDVLSTPSLGITLCVRRASKW